MNINYGEEILAARSRRRIRQDTLAKKAGLLTATLVDIEQGRIGIDEETYNKILKAIDAFESESAENAA